MHAAGQPGQMSFSEQIDVFGQSLALTQHKMTHPAHNARARELVLLRVGTCQAIAMLAVALEGLSRKVLVRAFCFSRLQHHLLNHPVFFNLNSRLRGFAKFDKHFVDFRLLAPVIGCQTPLNRR